MAGNLSDILKKSVKARGPGGTLSEESGEEVQSLASKAGMSAPPTTPLGTALIGGTPDQQKMAGTPQQKQFSLNLAQQAPVGTGLSDALRRGQARSIQTAEEQGSTKKSQDLQNLGNVGDRVQDVINSQKARLQAQAQQAGGDLSLQAQVAGSVGGVAVTGDMKRIIRQFRDDPSNPSNALALNKALGRNINSVINPAEVDQLYESAVSTIASGAAGIVDDDLDVSDLVATGKLGYTTTQLSQLLGVPEAEISKYSVGQLRDAVDRVGAQEMSQTAKLEEQKGSLNLGTAEQQLAGKAAREMSATGVRASEADYGALEQQISKADTILFAGEPIQVEDLLANETISKYITEYMQAGEGSDIRNRIDKFEPQLKQFIDSNKQVLQDATGRMQKGAQSFADIQAHNKSLQQMGGVRLDQAIIDKFLPSSNELSDKQINIDDIPVLHAGAGLPEDQRRQYITNLNGEVAHDPQTVQDFEGLSSADIQKWNIQGSGDSSPFHTNYVVPKRNWEAVQAAGTDPDKLTQIAANVTGAADASNKLQTHAVANAFGIGPGVPETILDVNGDGVLDPPDQLAMSMRAANPRPSLRGGPGSNQVYTKAVIPPPPPMTPEQEAIIGKLQGAVRPGGAIDAVKLQELSGNLTMDEAIAFRKMGVHSSDPHVADRTYYGAREVNTDKALTSLRALPGAERIAKLKEIQAQGDSYFDPDMVRRELDDAVYADERDTRPARKEQEEADARARKRKRESAPGRQLTKPMEEKVVEPYKNYLKDLENSSIGTDIKRISTGALSKKLKR